MKSSRRRFKALVAPLLGAALAISLAACGSSTQGSTGDNGGEKTVVFVPFKVGNAYFDAVDAGIKTAAKEYGWNYSMKGSTAGTPAGQVEVIKSLIQQRPDALIIDPGDASSLNPVIKQARDAGIVVVTTDQDAPDSARQAFVQPAGSDAIADQVLDLTMEQAGAEGEVALVLGFKTVSQYVAWDNRIKDQIKAKYPNAKIVYTDYAVGADSAAATAMAKSVMSKYPNLKAFMTVNGSAVAPAVSQAITDQNKIGKVLNFAVSTPNQMKPYVESGAANGIVLWDTNQLGFLSGWAAEQLMTGKTFSSQNSAGPDLPAVAYDDQAKTLLLGPPLVITKDSIDQYDF